MSLKMRVFFFSLLLLPMSSHELIRVCALSSVTNGSDITGRQYADGSGVGDRVQKFQMSFTRLSFSISQFPPFACLVEARV